MGVLKLIRGGMDTPTIAAPAATKPRPTGDNRLSDSQCRNAAPEASIKKLSDGKGLYLAVMPTGAKLWRLKYRHAGKEGVYSIGEYPEVGLSEARKRRDEARAWLRDGKDPVKERRAQRATEGVKQDNTFAAVAATWLEAQDISDGHRKSQQQRLNDELLPTLGEIPITELTTAQVLEALRKTEARGLLETTAKCRRIASQVCRYAIATGLIKNDPADTLKRGVLKAPVVMNRATVAAEEMPALLAQIAAVPAEVNTKLAFYWLLLTASRTVETRFANWGEIRAEPKIKGQVWDIPAERMKMKRGHVVPLSRQALVVLKKARAIRATADSTALLFPGFTRHGALSENALLAVLARAGYFGRQTGHGFRASFSTWAHETADADPDVIEACLAHQRGDVRAVYNRALYLPQRYELLQRWADQLTTWGLRLP